MWNQRQRQQHLRQRERTRLANRQEVAASRDTRTGRCERGQERQHGGKGQNADHKCRPADGGNTRNDPACEQRQECHDRHETAPQIVKHLPTSDHRNRGTVEKNPRQQLPIASSPTVLSGGVNLVMRRVFLDQFDIAQQSGTRKQALEQIVTEHRRFRHTALERGLERIEVVDSLAGVTALAEQILIHVRDRAGVRVHSGVAREDALKHRSLALVWKRDGHPRLQHGVALNHPFVAWIEARTVQRMAQGTDQFLCHTARQARVRVEGDDETNTAWNLERFRFNRNKTGVSRAAQQSIEFVQLAAFAFPTHPTPFALAPFAVAVIQQKPRATAGSFAVTVIQLLDAVAGGSQREGIFGHRLKGRIGEIGQQGKMQMAFAVGEVTHLEPFDFFAHTLFITEQGRHHDHRSQVICDPIQQLEFRQCARRETRGDIRIHQREGKFRGGNDHQESQKDAQSNINLGCIPQPDGDRHGQNDRDGSQISGQRRHDVKTKQPALPRGTKAQLALEFGPTLRNQKQSGIFTGLEPDGIGHLG